MLIVCHVQMTGGYVQLYMSETDSYLMFINTLRSFVLIVTFSFISIVNCGPRYDDGGGFIPSSISYLEKNGKAQDQLAIPSQIDKRREELTKRDNAQTNDILDRNQEARFGFTNIGSTGTGYAVSPYAPAKIDLGGLLLGAIIGVGSILIIPKLLYVLSGTYGAYARSEENGFAQSVTKLDDALARHGIDTTSCMQRAVCTYSRQAAAAAASASASTDDESNEDLKMSSFDRMVNAVTTNNIFRTAMQGTAIQEAVEAGRTGRNCSQSYPHCGFSMETILSLLSNFLTIISAANTHVTTPTAHAS